MLKGIEEKAKVLSPAWLRGWNRNLRFLPDDINGDEPGPGDVNVNPDPDPAQKVVDDSEAEEKKRKEEFDKQKQRADQADANFRKARQESEQYKSQLEQMQEEQGTLKEQLAELEKKAESQGIDVDNLLKEEDYEGTDLALVKAIKLANKRIDAKDEALTKKIKVLEETKAKLEKEAAERQTAAERQGVFDGLLVDLDDEYGAQFRNPAIKLWNEKIRDGEVPKGNPAMSARILEKCYKQAKAAAKKSGSDTTIPTDDGKGGATPPAMHRSKLKPGTLAEVTDQLEAAAKT